MTLISSKEAFRDNIFSRLEALEVYAYAACKAHGKKGGWLTDMLRRTPKGVPLDVKDEVADMLGVPREFIDRPGADMKRFKAPPWVEGAQERSRAPHEKEA